MSERERLIELLKEVYPKTRYIPMEECREKIADYLLDNGVIVPPCKIGDRVWGIRRFHDVERVQEGIVNEMYFLKDMRLQIVIKSVCRGTFGEKIFSSREEAEAASKARQKNENGSR